MLNRVNEMPLGGWCTKVKQRIEGRNNMKKVFLAGMATVMALSVSVAHAAPEFRKSVMEDSRRALEKGAIKGIDETSKVAAQKSIADLLVGVARNADNAEMAQAISRTISIRKSDGSVKQVSLEEVSRKLLMDKQSLDKTNRNDLSAADKAHFDQMQQFLEVSAQFLTLASRTSEVRANLDAQTQKEVDAFNKQLSLIGDMQSFDTRELKSHVDIMQAAINAKVSPDVKGDQAFAAALGKGKRSQADLDKKLDDIIGCEI
jgi:hypothetical protein